jgi:cell shape-determining protein MreD
MSDIGFQGIVVGLVGVAMLAIAVLGFIVEAVLQWKRIRARRSTRGFLLGPLVYAITGGVLVTVAEKGSIESREVLDNWSWLVALLALLPWVAAHWRRRG